VRILASVLALGEYSHLKDKYEQQLDLNRAAEAFAHQVNVVSDLHHLYIFFSRRFFCC